MCLIIHKRQNIVLPKSLIYDSFHNCKNDDGWGISHYDGDKLQIYKGFKLSELYYITNELKDEELLIHLRFSTHGTDCIENTHPFDVGHGVVMHHNGIIDGFNYRKVGDNTSDTFKLARWLKANLDNPDILFDEDYQRLLLLFSDDSRFAFHFPTGEILKFGNYDWVEWQGLELSNMYAWTLHYANLTTDFDAVYSFSNLSLGDESWNNLDIDHVPLLKAGDEDDNLDKINDWQNWKYDEYPSDDSEEDDSYEISINLTNTFEDEKYMYVYPSDVEKPNDVIYTDVLNELKV